MIFNTIDKLQKEGKFDEVSKLIEKVPIDTAHFKSINNILQNNGEMVRQIYNSKLFNPSEKRQLIDDMYQQMINISKYALETLN